MRERLTLAFVVVSVVLGVSAFAVRSYYLSNAVREHYNEVLQIRADLIGHLIDERVDAGKPVDDSFVQSITPDQTRVVVDLADDGRSQLMTGVGDGFSGSMDADDHGDDLWASVNSESALVTVFLGHDVVRDLTFSDPWSIVLLFVLLALFAGVVGYGISQALSRPFRRLASAASALGRGRFDLDLPRSRIPEAQAIASALESSGAQLRERISSGQALSEHASHALRTPLTALRMELEDLTLNDDLPEDAVSAILRSISRIDSLDMVTGELAALARGGSLVAGADISLRELATSSSQRWADELAHHDRTLTAAAEGDIETTYTPGPVEHILELLLVDVLHRGRGPLRLVFEAGADGHLRIRIMATEELRTRLHTEPVDSPFKRARAVAAALGGRIEGDDPAGSLDIWLPRR